MTIEVKIIEWVSEMESLHSDTSTSAEARKGVLREYLAIAGTTGAFFGGFDGMKQLHDACEAMTGNNNEIGYVLNRVWDGIGGWLS